MSGEPPEAKAERDRAEARVATIRGALEDRGLGDAFASAQRALCHRVSAYDEDRSAQLLRALLELADFYDVSPNLDGALGALVWACRRAAHDRTLPRDGPHACPVLGYQSLKGFACAAPPVSIDRGPARGHALAMVTTMARLARSRPRRIPGGAPVALAVPLSFCFALLTAACGSSGAPSLVTAPTTGAAKPAQTALPVAVDSPPPTDAPDESVHHAALPPAFDPAIVRDPRRPPRALALVVTEVQQFEMLLRVTAASSPDRPLIERRIAEDYVELEKAATTAGAVTGDPARHHRTAENAHAAALRNYEALVAGTPGDPRIDEVRYFLAYERERGGDLAGARKGYLDLLVQTPSSKLVPLAYLAFAEMFFSEAAADPSKLELAKQAYLKVVATPPPGNGAYAYAWYRLASVLENQGDREAALHALDKAVEAATTFPQLPGSAELRKEAQGQRDALSPTSASSPP